MMIIMHIRKKISMTNKYQRILFVSMGSVGVAPGEGQVHKRAVALGHLWQ